MKVNSKADKAKVIIAKDIKPEPEEHEISAARIVAEYINDEVRFIKRRTGYMAHTADIEMQGVEWEMKATLTNKKKTLGGTLRKATKQSKNIIIDCRMSPLPMEVIENYLRFELVKRKDIKRLLLITKEKKVVEFHK